MKKFTRLGKPFKSYLEERWYVPAEKLPTHFLTTALTVEELGLLQPSFDFSFCDEDTAYAAAKQYYSDHGFAYPYNGINLKIKVQRAFVVESEIMRFI